LLLNNYRQLIAVGLRFGIRLVSPRKNRVVSW